jgi:hypothetical protein
MEEAPEAFEVRAYDDQGTVEVLEINFFNVVNFLF